MTRVCLLNPTRIVKRPVSELAHHLKKRGHEVCVLTPSQKGYDKKEHHLRHLSDIEVVEFPTISPIPVEFEWPMPLPGFIRTLRTLSRRYDTFQIWTHFYLHVVIAVIYLTARKKRVILTMDTMPGDSFRVGGVLQHLFRIYNRTIGRWIINRADVLTVYGDSLRRIITRRIRPQTEVVTVPTGITPFDITSQRKGKIRKEFGFKDKRIITFIGLPGTRKGIDTVIEVAKTMQGDEVAFLVVGDSPRRSYWQKRSPPHMVFAGRRDDIYDILRDTDALFLPSRGEGLPGVVMEAMMAGVPVVASRIPCIDELVVDGKTGYLNEVDDIDGFRESLNKAMGNKRMGRNARRAIEAFGWDTIAKKYEDLY